MINKNLFSVKFVTSSTRFLKIFLLLMLTLKRMRKSLFRVNYKIRARSFSGDFKKAIKTVTIERFCYESDFQIYISQHVEHITDLLGWYKICSRLRIQENYFPLAVSLKKIVLAFMSSHQMLLSISELNASTFLRFTFPCLHQLNSNHPLL